MLYNYFIMTFTQSTLYGIHSILSIASSQQVPSDITLPLALSFDLSPQMALKSGFLIICALYFKTNNG